MKKRWCFLVLVFFSIFLFSQTAIPPSGGDGAEANPYQISSLENLYWIAADSTNRHYSYIQMNDIDASETKNWFPHPDGYNQGWPSIGNQHYSLQFLGNFDGQGYVIENLYSASGALFGTTSGSEIKNLGLVNVSTMGGALIVSALDNTKVTKCFSTGRVNDGGGLIGSCDYGTVITECYSTCDVTGDFAGGLIGDCFSGVGVYDCYSTGDVTGDYYVGGFVGDFYYNCIMERCYSVGKVTGKMNLGGLSAKSDDSEIINSFWNYESAGLDSSSGGTALSAVQMRTLSNFTNAGWDFSSIWSRNDGINNGYPYLQWQKISALPESRILNFSDINGSHLSLRCLLENIGNSDIIRYGICWNTIGSPTIDDALIDLGNLSISTEFTVMIEGLMSDTQYYIRVFAENFDGLSYSIEKTVKTLTIDKIQPSGTGTTESPYQIENLNNLLWLSQSPENWNKVYKQTADINAVETKSWNDAKGFAPIGNYHNRFTGSYDGLEHTISNLTISRSNEDYIGLFGYSQNSEFNNIILNDIYISGSEHVGGLSGYNDNTLVYKCHVSGSLYGIFRVGGLLGKNVYSDIYQCSSKCDLEASGFTGGLTGESWYSKISNSSFVGNVSGSSFTGGLAGYSNESDVLESFSEGNITGNGYCGGFIGASMGGGEVSYCHFTGNMSGNYDVGGLIGYCNSVVKNCHSNCNVSGMNGVGGFIGNTDLSFISECYSVGFLASDEGAGFIKMNDNSIVENCFTTIQIENGRSGFVYLNKGELSVIRNCYSAATMSGDENYGLVAQVLYGATTENSFWDIETTGSIASLGGKGLTTTEMKNYRSYSSGEGWNITNDILFADQYIWVIDGENNSGYPYLSWQLTTGIEDDELALPDKIALFQNYPNPFNPYTTIKFALPVSGQVKLTVYNSIGQVVRKLVDGNFKAGSHSVIFNADGLNSGMYFYQLYVDNAAKDSKKLLILK